nr:excisionase [Thomasclavelia cocleata]
MSSEHCTFCLKVGKSKKLVKRKEFELWCQSMSEIV